MGKSKHKKHHRHDDDDDDDDSSHDERSAPPLAADGSGLKLILKVGSGSSKTHREKHKKKKKKKDRKKEKHKHHHKDKNLRHAAQELLHNPGPSIKDEFILTSPRVDPVAGIVHPPKMELLRSPLQHVITPRLLPESSSAVKMEPELTAAVVIAPTVTTADLLPSKFVSETSRKALHKLLDQFLYHLQKKDVNQFFAIPVDDAFAPGYSEIIHHPMDFSTMKSKLHSGKYMDLETFKADFELMCNNACIYNLPETIYYKAAKKLLHQGQRLMSQEKIMAMRSHAPFVKQIDASELGFSMAAEDKPHGGHSSRDIANNDDDDENDDVSKVIEDLRDVIRRPLGRFEAIPDDLSPQEILDQVRAAAGGAANRLRINKPKSGMGYLQMREDGSLSFSFLLGIGTAKNAVTLTERPVSLSPLIGRIKQGSVTAQIPIDQVPLTNPLLASSYESTFANLTPDETEVIANTYGDEVGVQYAESIINFSRSCEYAMFIVDHLLDILTGNEHRKTSKVIEEQKSSRRDDQIIDFAFNENQNSEVDFDSLRSLSEAGIDVSFIDSIQKQLQAPGPQSISDVLQQNVSLINELRELQRQRLATNQSAQPQPPSDRESELASMVQKNLIQVVGFVRPGDDIIRESLQRVINISLNAAPTLTNDN